jgi:hypothetical protein
VTPVNDPRRDGKILVAVGFAGSQVARGGHQERATFVGVNSRAPVIRAGERNAPPI